MKVLFGSNISQKNYIENNQTSFKAVKSINPVLMQKTVVQHSKFLEALKAKSFVGKISMDISKIIQKVSTVNNFAKFSNPKTNYFINNYLSLLSKPDTEEDFLAKTDYLDFVANNIKDAEFNEALLKITKTIKPVLLPLAKHLTTFFQNDLEKVNIQLNKYKHTFLPRPVLENCLEHLNKKDVDTNSFLQIVEMLNTDNNLNEYNQIINDLLLSEQKEVNVGLLRAKVFEIYANKHKVLNINGELYNKFDLSFIKEVSNFLKEKGDKIHPLMLLSFISHVRPHNFNVVEYLCSNNCDLKLLNTREKLVNKLEGDVDCSEFLDFLKNILEQGLSEDFIIGLTSAYINSLKYLFHEEKVDILQKIIDLKKKVEKNPEKYLSNDADFSSDILFNCYTNELAKTFYVYDEQTINELFDKRIKNVITFLQSFTTTSRNLDMLKELTFCKKPNGDSFTTTEKLNFARLVSVFSDYEIKRLEDMAIYGVVDIETFKKDFFYKILRDLNFKQEEIQSIDTNKFKKWNITYLPMIAQVQNKNAEGFTDLFKSSFSNNFWEYIHDESNSIGKTNLKTKSLFEEYGISYEKWIDPPNTKEIKFQITDKNNEKLSQIVSAFLENIDIVRKSPFKNFFDKRFGEYIENEKFVLPKKIASSPEHLEKFIRNILVQLEPVWKRAKNNLLDEKKENAIKEQASNTLTIKEHFEELLKEILKTNFSDIEKTLDLTVKMWDRIPEKDLFQGNYSTCCLSLDRTYGYVMPEYLLNTSLNMIELVDNEIGRTIGNALCYFALDDNDRPAFVIDNIEINNNYKISNESATKIIENLKEYISNLCKEISTQKIPIYMGRFYNDVKPRCESVIQNMKLLGELKAPRIYFDAFSGWCNYKHKKEVSLFKID